MDREFKDELESFKDLWEGGYFGGDPLRPMTRSTYGQLGFISTLHATYLACIKPYISEQTVSLEIGPGRGAWTKALLRSKEIYALDALPEEHNRFYDYLGHPKNAKYFHVSDFKCDMLPDNHFDYMFSYGCLCHVSFEGITEYAKSLYPKLKRDSNCFWMIADHDKYKSALSNLNSLSVWGALMPASRRYLPLKWLYQYLMRKDLKRSNLPIALEDLSDKTGEPRPGRWYEAGVERTCTMLKQVGYRIVDSDVGTCLRDPIIHFSKG